MKGRKPKSTDQHKADGTLEKSRHANRVSAPAADGIPHAPANFDKRHRERWVETCEMLQSMNILSTTDNHAVRRYVELAILADDAYQRHLETGEKEDRISYLQSVAQQKKIMDDFGFTPRSRMSMKAPDKPKTSKILELMAGGKKKAV